MASLPVRSFGVHEAGSKKSIWGQAIFLETVIVVIVFLSGEVDQEGRSVTGQVTCAGSDSPSGETSQCRYAHTGDEGVGLS